MRPADSKRRAAGGGDARDMDLGPDKAKLLSKSQIAALIGDPIKMRLAVVFAVAALGVGGIYYPFSDQIAGKRAAMETEKNRLETVQQVDSLRRDVAEFRSRIGKQSDSNEWVQYLLDGSRKIGVQLRGMEIKEPRKVGPYVAVSLQLEVQGTYPQLRSFVEWLDQSDRLLRVESLRLEKTPNVILMKIYVLGIVQKNA